MSFPSIEEELLLSVQKPARYINGEWGCVEKEWEANPIRFCLIYPDIYEIGMSNSAIHILYYLLNEMDGVLCDRAFFALGGYGKHFEFNKHTPFRTSNGQTTLSQFHNPGLFSSARAQLYQFPSNSPSLKNPFLLLPKRR
jgi:hypothetical protein